jgi:hypothetical protein
MGLPASVVSAGFSALLIVVVLVLVLVLERAFSTQHV